MEKLLATAVEASRKVGLLELEATTPAERAAAQASAERATTMLRVGFDFLMSCREFSAAVMTKPVDIAACRVIHQYLSMARAFFEDTAD